MCNIYIKIHVILITLDYKIIIKNNCTNREIMRNIFMFYAPFCSLFELAPNLSQYLLKIIKKITQKLKTESNYIYITSPPLNHMEAWRHLDKFNFRVILTNDHCV